MVSVKEEVMELLGINKNTEEASADEPLYRALACGDLPAAYIISKELKQKPNPATAFNCGLCFLRLGEWEKALAELKRAEQAFGNPPEYEISERKLFLKAFEVSGSAEAFLPLDPGAPSRCRRYALIRTRWLIALCLFWLGREGEAAPIVRFLSQYNIQVDSEKALVK